MECRKGGQRRTSIRSGGPHEGQEGPHHKHLGRPGVDGVLLEGDMTTKKIVTKKKRRRRSRGKFPPDLGPCGPEYIRITGVRFVPEAGEEAAFSGDTGDREYHPCPAPPDGVG